MRFFVFICVVAAATAFKGEPLVPGIAFPEDIKDSVSDCFIQGWPAAPRQFPHMVFYNNSLSGGGDFVCGGSLISTRWVVTAAHCLYRRRTVVVHLGSTNSSSSSLSITTRELYIHPNYNPSNINNDIALIDLETDVQLTANIQPIRIVNQVSDAYVGRVVVVSGFGHTTKNGSLSQSLNYVYLTIITNALCAEKLGSFVINSTICGVGILSEFQGTCTGDSGSPVILENENVLVGIVSFGTVYGCGSGYPSAFVRPNYFIPWLTQVTGITFE